MEQNGMTNPESLEREYFGDALKKLTAEQITAIWNGMPGGFNGFCVHWCYQQFAQKVLEAVERPEQDTAPLKDELRWAINSNQDRPRTEAALRWALETIEAVEQTNEVE